jgi:GT2 family glycosyltransferase
VVGREDDAPTREALAQVRGLCAGKTAFQAGWVIEPGHLPPVWKGLELTSSDIVAFVDDDVTATSEWLDHLVAPFADPSVGVVGGRAVIPGSQRVCPKGKPGWTTWYGKTWGNVACLEGGSALEVQAVQECNWAWRRRLLASLELDPILNFDDASMYGLDLCLQARRKGFRVLCEPRAFVFHHVAPRAPALDRSDKPRRMACYSRNYTYIMLKHLPWWRRPAFLAWWFLIGERGSWGLGAALFDTFTGHLPRGREVWHALTGKVEGLLLSRLRVHSHGG